uniref:Uncharacterized protein n=1 Tax=Oryza nivara TaxID=4536 RepID=A0A0E0HEN7_ORYNI
MSKPSPLFFPSRRWHNLRRSLGVERRGHWRLAMEHQLSGKLGRRTAIAEAFVAILLLGPFPTQPQRGKEAACGGGEGMRGRERRPASLGGRGRQLSSPSELTQPACAGDGDQETISSFANSPSLAGDAIPSIVDHLRGTAVVAAENGGAPCPIHCLPLCLARVPPRAFIEAETDLDFGRLVDEEEDHDEDVLQKLVPDIRCDSSPRPSWRCK